MRTTPTPAADITEGDLIDLTPALDWLRVHADGPTDGIDTAASMASYEYATITEVTNEKHSVTGEPVIVLHNTVYDVAVPAALSITRVSA
jgi:hypothetical protein